MNNFCYVPVKGVDDEIAKLFFGPEIKKAHPHLIAILRGMYDEANPNSPLDTSNIGVATRALVGFKAKLSINNRKSMIAAGTSLYQAYKQLILQLPAEKRLNRVNMIASMFSRVVDMIEAANSKTGKLISRTQIIEGYYEGGQKRAGQFSIFEKVYNELLNQYATYLSQDTDEGRYRAAEIKTVLNNWGALTAFVKLRLREIEGVKLGNNVEWSSDVTPNDFAENEVDKLFNAEESTKDGWQIMTDYESAFGSVGTKVRKFLGSIPVVHYSTTEGWTVERDDLGHPKLLDPIKAHQSLMNILRGVSSEQEMMAAFYSKDGSFKEQWLKPVVEQLLKDEVLRSQFFRDFKKNFQPYSILLLDEDAQKRGITRYKTKLINKIEDLLGGAYLLRVKLGRLLDKNSIYNDRGLINWEQLQIIRRNIRDWLLPEVSTQKGKFYDKNIHRGDKAYFLVDTLRRLGIDIDASTVESIFSDRKDLDSLIKNIKEILVYGINSNFSKSQLESLEKGEYSSMSNLKFSTLLNRQNSRKGSLKEKVERINLLITKHREGLRLESRARYVNPKGVGVTLFSDIMPSYMGDKFDLIESYVKNNDKEGLKKFLEINFLKSSYFKAKDGTILNKWIEELYNSCTSNEPLSESFAGKFSYIRDLGSEDTAFENFTSKMHMTDMITRFFSDKEISENADTALFPLFILGDANVSKYIRARVYNSETIIKGLYNIYRQEKRRMLLQVAVEEDLEKKGKKGIKNFSSEGIEIIRDSKGKIIDVKGEFALLPFLNNPKYAALLKDGSRDNVEEAIRTYMKDSYEGFKEALNKMGLLATKPRTERGPNNEKIEIKEFSSLPRGITEENIDRELMSFYWNTRFATLQQLQLMTIDISFYKDIKDLQKRYKEIHAPGSKLNVDATYKGERVSDGIERCLYINEIELNSEKEHPKFFEALQAKLKKSIFKNDYLEKYRKSALTDGQGYRTLRSYRKVMIMSGKWTDTMEYAYQEIERIKRNYPKGAIPQSELKKIDQLQVVFQPFKPYMFTHEHYTIGEDTLLIPVQHKYSEAVLIPELMQPGKLQDLAYYMEDNDIDMVCATSAVKVGCYGQADITNASNEEELKEALSKGVVHNLSYSDYREQTNVPDHAQSSRLFGTQLRKLIMSGLKFAKDYSSYVGGKLVNLGGSKGKVNLNGRSLLQFYNALIVANILRSEENFEEMLKDPQKVSDALIQSVANSTRESLDDLLAYGLENGDFAVPLCEAGLEHNSSSLMLSMFKKIVNKQSIMGNSLVQASALGLVGYKNSGDLELVTDDTGNVLYCEVEVPWDLSYEVKDKNGNVTTVPLDREDYCNEDGTLKLDSDGEPLIEKVLPGVTRMIAYRIPTERAYSVMNIRVKRFSRKTAGGTIKVPLECTTISGFDFDIDKLYLMRREFKTKSKPDSNNPSISDLEFEKYDFEKSPLENSKAAINNMLLDLMEARLQDEETFNDRYTPGGFTGASEAARIIRELIFGDYSLYTTNGKLNVEALYKRAKEGEDPEPNYDPSDPLTIITYNQQNQIAGKLIGIFANHNSNHSFISSFREFKLFEPIKFCGHSYDDLLHAPEGVDVDLNVAEYLAASVDAVKDPVLNFLGYNTLTADMGALLARIGYTPVEIGLLFNQPIIKEVCEHALNKGTTLDIAITDIKNKYLADNRVEDTQSYDPTHISTETLMNSIVDPRKNPSTLSDYRFINNQMEILNLFMSIHKSSAELGNFVKSTKFTASNSVGSTLGDLYAQQMRVENYVNSTREGTLKIVTYNQVTDPIIASEELLSLDKEKYYDLLIENPVAYEQAMYDCNRKLLKAVAKYYPYETSLYKKMRKNAAALTKTALLDADTINSLHSDLMVYLLSIQENSIFNGENIMDDSGITYREYYTTKFAEELFKKLDSTPELKGLPVFKYMVFGINKEDNVIANVQGVGGLDRGVKDSIRESWAELARTDPKLATDLFMYNFYRLGFHFGYNSFMNLAPSEVKRSIMIKDNFGDTVSYTDFIRNVINGKIGCNINEFLVQYILNHSDNYKFVFTADRSETAMGYLMDLVFDSGEAVDEFDLDITNMIDEDSSVFINSRDFETKETFFKPVISIKGVLYVARGDHERFNGSTTGVMTYRRADKLGVSKVSMSYYLNRPDGLSVPQILSEELSIMEPEGNSSLEPGTPGVPFNRLEAIAYVAELIIAAKKKKGLLKLEDSGLSVLLEMESLLDDELKQKIDDIRVACRENGILMMDDDGNLLLGC